MSNCPIAGIVLELTLENHKSNKKVIYFVQSRSLHTFSFLQKVVRDCTQNFLFQFKFKLIAFGTGPNMGNF